MRLVAFRKRLEFKDARKEKKWTEKNKFTNIIPLEIEHIDGNYLNNIESNLLLLCPNCHSLTSTYKGANKGNGRKDRSKYSLYGNPELGK